MIIEKILLVILDEERKTDTGKIQEQLKQCSKQTEAIFKTHFLKMQL